MIKIKGEIENYCIDHNISYSNDSYYFTINGQDYRVSNHSVEVSKRNSGGKYHHEVIYIPAGKSRLIEIHQALLRGEKLNEMDIRKGRKMKFYRDGGGLATVEQINTTIGTRYVALAQGTSRTFKTASGAVKWLQKLGYK